MYHSMLWWKDASVALSSFMFCSVTCRSVIDCRCAQIYALLPSVLLLWVGLQQFIPDLIFMCDIRRHCFRFDWITMPPDSRYCSGHRYRREQSRRGERSDRHRRSRSPRAHRRSEQRSAAPVSSKPFDLPSQWQSVPSHCETSVLYGLSFPHHWVYPVESQRWPDGTKIIISSGHWCHS